MRVGTLRDLPLMESDAETTSIAGIQLTHPARVLFPDAGSTKADLAAYYRRACTRMLPYLDKRPLTLLRCPDGRDGDCFYQKHANASVPPAIGRIEIQEQSGETREYMLVDSVQGLVSTAQIAALELHIWGARSDRLDRPERVVFDLDPDESLPFARVRQAALELRELLLSLDLASYPLLTGGKGVHVIVPIRRTRTWQEAKSFARDLALRLTSAAPQLYVATPAIDARRGKIYVDWLRNDRGATAIAPYSLRARAGAPVAAPVDWPELDKARNSRVYHIGNIGKRLPKAAGVWRDYFSNQQSITRRHLRLIGKQ